MCLFVVTLGPTYKRMHLETDISMKSDRVEWGHARYQTVFRPDQAYELVVEWLTSSGSIIAELVSFHLLKTVSTLNSLFYSFLVGLEKHRLVDYK